MFAAVCHESSKWCETVATLWVMVQQMRGWILYVTRVLESQRVLAAAKLAWVKQWILLFLVTTKLVGWKLRRRRRIHKSYFWCQASLLCYYYCRQRHVVEDE